MFDYSNFVFEVRPIHKIFHLFSRAKFWMSALVIGLINCVVAQESDSLLKASIFEEVVISGTLRTVTKLESPVLVEVFNADFFKANPTPSVFEALQGINGVRPQINCSICNTGDVHINGLEGPYTMVLVDGMPIVSGLSTVYGLSSMPQSIIDRVEVIKGPASTLYGSEAVGGLINIITKKAENAIPLQVDIISNTWAETNLDVGWATKFGHKLHSLTGLNRFNYQNPIDRNSDGFTDVTLQDRISLFNKWSMERREGRLFSVAARYVNEERWGGQLHWTPQYRGSDSIYGESIDTRRWEFFGQYQLPFQEDVVLSFSANSHLQNSAYGNLLFNAQQRVGFAQCTWNKTLNHHHFLAGITYRYTFYDDNTVVTTLFDSLGQAFNLAQITHLPGLFGQHEWNLGKGKILLTGLRYDRNSIHGTIVSPRLNFKWKSPNGQQVLRCGIGNGYRIAQVFTEDHASLTGARKVVFLSQLKPERSWNGTVNFTKRILNQKGTLIGVDAALFYTHFDNKIIADLTTDPNKIIYDNLKGTARSTGLSVQTECLMKSGIKFTMGATIMDVSAFDDGKRQRQMFTERFTATWNLAYPIRILGISIDYSGNVYSPMLLPLLSPWDPRKDQSPWWSIQNMQFTKSFNGQMEFYGGVKNLLNWTPNKGNPFLIARSHDPFDRMVEFDSDGKALVSPENPFGLTFDPTYVYAPNQGRRLFIGIRWNLNGRKP